LLLSPCCRNIDWKAVYPDLNEGAAGTSQEQIVKKDPKLDITIEVA
jgi:hypothetical protein